ncbi:hypothetical protein EPJ66_11665 [Brachyspira aalborgi]|uniref:hypothetical protein n=1 Tax=Brachyspira aalborgi TaxID=29522 RepID=UPI0011C8574D|nr:hypothetical protein [Brachyspira aalborgi]TXJ49591.1 hypothetical protein EPJ66_11665 [Brachyspira aalborgi]
MLKDIKEIEKKLIVEYGEAELKEKIDTLYNERYKGKYSYEYSKRMIMRGLYKFLGDSSPSHIYYGR